jgi:hypothetical protein
MSRTKKKSMSRTKKKSISNKKNTKKSNIKQKHINARIIIKQSFGGFVEDMNTIKKLIESVGGTVEIVVFEDIKYELRKPSHNIKFKHVDIQFFIEHVYVEDPLKLFPADKSYIFINQEYMADWDYDRMKDKTVIPLCKTHISYNQLKQLGINTTKYIGFGNNTSILIDNIDTKTNKQLSKIPNLFVHIAGQSPLKGTIILIKTWNDKHIKEPLIITAKNLFGGNTKLFNYWKSLRPTKIKGLPDIDGLKSAWNTYLPNVEIPLFEKVGSIYLCDKTLDINIIRFLQNIADVHMCPSAIEGWGQYIDEGRRTKSVVLTLDAPPMNELIDVKSGVLVPATKGPSTKQILPPNWTQYLSKFANKDTYTTNINNMYMKIQDILKMTESEKRKMGETAFAKSKKDYELFERNFIKLL